MIPILEDIIRGLLNGTMTPEQAKFYLEQHERLQAEVDGLTDVPFTRAQVTLDILRKCVEQDKLWGANRMYPSFNLAVANNADNNYQALATYHEVPTVPRAKMCTEYQANSDELSWMTILVEEVAKLPAKYEDGAALREQLIDVAGVTMQWASQLTPEPEYTVQLEEQSTVDNGDGTQTMTLGVKVTLDDGAKAGGELYETGGQANAVDAPPRGNEVAFQATAGYAETFQEADHEGPNLR